MKYALLSLAFLLLAVGLSLILRRASMKARGAQTDTAPTSTAWRGTVRIAGVNEGAVLIASAALLVLTAVFDSLMIASNLFTYSESLISGIRVGLAPIEDFAYPVAMVILLPALWVFLRSQPAISVRLLLKHAFVVSRPVSWINTAFPFAAGYLMSTREVDWILVVGTLYYLVPYNLAMYGINDVFDYESDINNPRKGGLEGALLPPSYHQPMLWLCWWSNVPFLVILLAVGSPLSVLAFAISTFAVIAYSAPILRFKERPFLDSLTSSTHFVSPALVGITVAGAQLDASVAVLLLSFFCWGIAAHAFGAVQDIGPDREAGIGSVATVVGARKTVVFSLVMWGVAGLLMLSTPWPGPLAAVLALPYLINCAPYLRVTDETAATTNAAWRRFIWLNYASGFLVTLLLILEWTTRSS
ncbi:prenyltransferase [Neomicrococcus aestuarii]|uniref:prenyltransferase n=1 Tax=Neomicrococcus aestuarii TaxID=556325 RepID=UPI000903CF4C|nr:prenyltransferase [Neomicrococcus aestuarii]